jgi:hypothetical protein
LSDLQSPIRRQVAALLRVDRPIPEQARERLRARLLGPIVPLPTAGGQPAGGHPAGGHAAAGHAAAGQPAASAVAAHASRLGARVLGWIGLAFVVGGVSGAALHARLSTRPPQVVFVDRVVPVAIPQPSPEPSATIVASESPAPSAPRLARPSSSATRASQLIAEKVLLDEARAHLVQGEPSRAIERLERHRRAFLNPLLAEERDAMWVEALAQAGRPAEARAHADAFRRTYPSSLFLATVDSAIASIP